MKMVALGAAAMEGELDCLILIIFNAGGAWSALVVSIIPAIVGPVREMIVGRGKGHFNRAVLENGRRSSRQEQLAH